MNPETTAPWVRLHSSHNQVYLTQTNKCGELINTLPNPCTQRPSMNIFLGRHNKNTALIHTFSGNFHRGNSPANSIRLELDYNTQQTASPLFIADCDIESMLSDLSQSCHTGGLTIPWASHSGTAVLSTVLTRCLFSFADSVWLFADDYGGDAGVRRVLHHLGSLQTRSIEPCGFKPRLIVVCSNPIQHDLETMGADELFSHMEVLHIPPQNSRVRLHHAALKRRLLQVVETSRQKRLTSCLLFSAKHMYKLMEASLLHITKSCDDPFDLIATARRGFSVAPIAGHIENFLRLAQDARPPYKAIQKFIASSLTMDAYPPFMHGFGPRMLFKTLYQHECLQACQAVYGEHDTNNLVVNVLEKYFIAFAESILQGEQTALAVRRDVIANTGKYRQLFRSNQSCFSCMRRRPEYPLQCGHLICDLCVEIFGQGITGSETELTITSCCICDCNAGRPIALMPKTAATRLLSIDGGGSRGVIPLESLQLIQELLGPDHRLQDLFDFAVGTSAGGLTALGLFWRSLSVDQSKQTFRTLARKIFEGSGPRERSLFGQLRRALKSALNDFVYDVKGMERALIDLFGDDTKLMGFNPFSSSTTKIAITAATGEAPTARLFTNYNGSQPCGTDCGYRLEHPQELIHEPSVWEVARATSAVPSVAHFRYRYTELSVIGQPTDATGKPIDRYRYPRYS